MSYQIPSNVVWQNTGFHLPETKNDKTVAITVSAESRWTANPNPGGGGMYDARGWVGHRPGAGGYKLPNADEGCLVGRIDGTAFMFAFDAKLVVSPRPDRFVLTFDVDGALSGYIFMGINDNNVGIGDNNGEMQVIAIDSRERA